MKTAVPPVKDLVLIGGGHSHVQVLKRFGMQPMPGMRLTLVVRDFETPYSGMLPGHVAGDYSWRDIHIDLGPLARFADARIIRAPATGIDPGSNHVHLAGRPNLRFDVLSINTGAEPGAGGGDAVPVKPIGGFLPRWRAMRERIQPGEKILIVGGGAGGVELALAMRRALPAVDIEIVTRSLLLGHHQRVAGYARAAIGHANVQITEGVEVETVYSTGVSHAAGWIAAKYVFWVTGVDAPPWTRDTGLGLDSGGFIEVLPTLQTVSHPHIFAAGDIASMRDDPRPKSGVFAVRQGPYLANNLRRYLREEPLVDFRPQREFLSLIGTGDGSAIVSRGRIAAAGSWAWRWKDWIDRRFMAQFQQLPAMTDTSSSGLPDSLQREMPDNMRCGGCGSKIAALPLSKALSRLRLEPSARVVQGIGDDAAIIQGAAGRWVITVDGFRSMVDDPYLFGRIAAHHSLNDVLAMGATPTAALAVVTVPLMSEAMMEDELYWVLKGGVDVFREFDIDLVGGHSAEGAELTLAFTITGDAEGAVLEKGTLSAGDRLILSKPLGTGVLLAAEMRSALDSVARQRVLDQMDQSNGPALAVAKACGVRAATDITGFGLLGHLAEMLRQGNVGADVHVGRVPALDIAHQLMSEGYQSSLQKSNERVIDEFEIRELNPTDPAVRLLVDPQTSGGMLFALPASAADRCVRELLAEGYVAAEVAEVTEATWRLIP